jgi:hypothetical protein
MLSWTVHKHVALQNTQHRIWHRVQMLPCMPAVFLRAAKAACGFRSMKIQDPAKMHRMLASRTAASLVTSPNRAWSEVTEFLPHTGAWTSRFCAYNEKMMMEDGMLK